MIQFNQLGKNRVEGDYARSIASFLAFYMVFSVAIGAICFGAYSMFGLGNEVQAVAVVTK